MMPTRLFATHRRAVLTATVCALVILGSVVLATWSLYQGRKDLCHGRDITLNIMQAIIIDARDQQVAHAQAKYRSEVLTFYNRQLARINEARC